MERRELDLLPADVLILGCGYTGRLVARQLVGSGHVVTATTRRPEALRTAGLAVAALDVQRPDQIAGLHKLVSPDTRVLISLPTVQGCNYMPAVMRATAGANRFVYLSTTGVYGGARVVDERTEAAPRTEREWARVAAELEVAKAASALILRPAAIYGPHRGIHSSMKAGTYQLLEGGTNFVSRIHVEDLAAHCIAGLFAEVPGAWPVADEEPCTSREIAEFCATLLDIPMPEKVASSELGETRRADRRVDGSAIRRALGLKLKYPSYRAGIPASIAVEAGEAEARERAR